MVTGSTYQHVHHFTTAKRLDVLQRGLLKLAFQFGWRLEAWAVFSNHYHFIGHSPESDEDATSLSSMLRVLHVQTARWINRCESRPNRQVWHNFYESRLTHQNSYLARLKYVHQNPVRHGLVSMANQYRWCSAAWFERSASPAMVKSIYRFKCDKLSVQDDFDVLEPEGEC